MRSRSAQALELNPGRLTCVSAETFAGTTIVNLSLRPTSEASGATRDEHNAFLEKMRALLKDPTSKVRAPCIPFKTP